MVGPPVSRGVVFNDQNSPILLPGYPITHTNVYTCQINPKYENKSLSQQENLDYTD